MCEYILCYIEKCQNSTILSHYDTINSICLAKDSTCSEAYASFYKN